MTERDDRPTSPAAGVEDAAVERYLADPTAPPAAEIAELERALAPLRFRGEAPPWPARRPVARWLGSLAAALVLLALGAAGLAGWVWSWPSGRPWAVLEGGPAALRVGETVRVPPGESLAVRVARIGWLRVEGGARLRLLATGTRRHRVALDQGTLRAGVWAPPGSLRIATPAGEVLDLGCAFRLRADLETTTVEVLSGWVQLENRWGESFVPAGARGTMSATGPPSVPVFRDADPRLRAAVERIEAGGGAAALVPALATARPRDALTLITLSIRRPEARELLLRRAAELAPPPSPDLLARALAGDRDAAWAWADSLPLPSTKRWIPNWRDRWPD